MSYPQNNGQSPMGQQGGGMMPPPPMGQQGGGMMPPPPMGQQGGGMMPPPPMGQQGGGMMPPPPMGQQDPIVPIGSFGRDRGFKTTIKIPSHNLKFDENYFLQLLAGSISLSKDEKKRIIESIPKLSQYQIDELIKIFEEEKRKFSELDVKHKEQLRALEAKHAAEWEALEMEQEQNSAQGEETAAVDDIRKSLGIDE